MSPTLENSFNDELAISLNEIVQISKNSTIDSRASTSACLYPWTRRYRSNGRTTYRRDVIDLRDWGSKVYWKGDISRGRSLEKKTARYEKVFVWYLAGFGFTPLSVHDEARTVVSLKRCNSENPNQAEVIKALLIANDKNERQSAALECSVIIRKCVSHAVKRGARYMSFSRSKERWLHSSLASW